uniref:Protein-disulfide reductase n=1 Tax=Dendroctonus ponderosae TaxID=77166 RepID=A0AAR5P4K0_DENPD
MTGTAHADFLPPDQAFQFQVVSTSQDQAELSWKIAEGYYLYHDQLKVSYQQTPVKLALPKPEDKDDPNFGLTQVHYGQVKTNMKVQPNQQFVVQWQGCAESGLCYPVQRTTVTTDADGLFPAQNLSKPQKLLVSTTQPEANEKILTAQKDELQAIEQTPSTDKALTEEKLSLPQGMLQRLDQWQQKQKGGTLIGAGLMGMIAALIVGPCMSAPLAGALIYVSQLNQPMLGASYLFVLGLGLGLPLFIAAVFGSHLLPKPGIWMDRLKFSFGFVMLALALYFARPLLPGILYLSLLGVVLITCSGYFLFKMLPHVHRSVAKIGLMLLSGLLVYAGGMQLYHVWSQVQVAHVESRLEWQKVSTAAQLQQVLAKHPALPVVIDVYADWCVACQPIEKEVIPRSDVQKALQNVVRIKLDLTHYHPSQDELLKEWQILGPPTFIFLNAAHQEQRELRLTGTFSATHLLGKLQQLQGEQP